MQPCCFWCDKLIEPYHSFHEYCINRFKYYTVDVEYNSELFFCEKCDPFIITKDPEDSIKYINFGFSCLERIYDGDFCVKDLCGKCNSNFIAYIHEFNVKRCDDCEKYYNKIFHKFGFMIGEQNEEMCEKCYQSMVAPSHNLPEQPPRL